MENGFGILASRFSVLLSTMEQRPKVVRAFVLISVVLHNVLRTHQGGLDRASIQAECIVNEPVVYVPDENSRNPLREEKYQQDTLKDYFSHVCALAW